MAPRLKATAPGKTRRIMMTPWHGMGSVMLIPSNDGVAMVEGSADQAAIRRSACTWESRRLSNMRWVSTMTVRPIGPDPHHEVIGLWGTSERSPPMRSPACLRPRVDGRPRALVPRECGWAFGRRGRSLRGPWRRHPGHWDSRHHRFAQPARQTARSDIGVEGRLGRIARARRARRPRTRDGAVGRTQQKDVWGRAAPRRTRARRSWPP